jgi:hypothetical protein
LGLGEQCLDVAIAGTVVEDFVVQERRQRNEIPAAKANVAALRALPAAHEAFALQERLWQRLQPLAIDKMPLAEPPPRGSRFGSPLVLSRVHWVRPEMVVEVSYVEWTPDGLLRHVVYLGERQDKLATEVRRSPPHAGEP